MTDPRIRKLSQLLIDYSLGGLKRADHFWIRLSGNAGLPLAKEVYTYALKQGALIQFDITPDNFNYLYYKHSKDHQLKAFPEINKAIAHWAHKRLSIISDYNTKELAHIDPAKIMLRRKTIKPLWKRMLAIPWCGVYYPTNAMAQEAGMSLQELEDFVLKACLIDWRTEEKKMKKLKRVLDHARKVQVIGKETDLSMSFVGRTFQICSGKHNMPDGEVFSCPLERSTTGKIYYEFPSNYMDNDIKGIRLVFKAGKVIKATAEANEKFLHQALATDPGAKRLGEFAIGTNYNIKQYMNNTLFDEKIGGTIHTALGRAYDEKEGGGKNKSAIHWDLVKDTRVRGSKVLVNGKCVLKDGKLLL